MTSPPYTYGNQVRVTLPDGRAYDARVAHCHWEQRDQCYKYALTEVEAGDLVIARDTDLDADDAVGE